MTMAPRRHPEKPRPVSARERAILFARVAEMEIVVRPDMFDRQPSAGLRASRSEHRAAVPRLARSQKTQRAAKSP